MTGIDWKKSISHLFLSFYLFLYLSVYSSSFQKIKPKYFDHIAFMWVWRLVKKKQLVDQKSNYWKKTTTISHPGFISSFCLSVYSSSFQKIKPKYFDHISIKWGRRLVKKKDRSIKNQIIGKKTISHPGFILSFCLSVYSSSFQKIEAKYFNHISVKWGRRLAPKKVCFVKKQNFHSI